MTNDFEPVPCWTLSELIKKVSDGELQPGRYENLTGRIIIEVFTYKIRIVRGRSIYNTDLFTKI